MVVNLKESKCTAWKTSTRSVIVASTDHGFFIVFSTFKACVAYFELPYHSVKSEKLPYTFEVGPNSHYYKNSKFTVERKNLVIEE